MSFGQMVENESDVKLRKDQITGPVSSVGICA